MERQTADFRPLIKALQLASAEGYHSLEEQLAEIELYLVSAQLNPDPYSALEMKYALNALSQIHTQGISPARGTADLAPFFENPHLESF